MVNPGQSYRSLGSSEEDSGLPAPPPDLLPRGSFPVLHLLAAVFQAGCHTLPARLLLPAAPCYGSDYSHQGLPQAGVGRHCASFVWTFLWRAPADDTLLGCHDSILCGVFLLPFPRRLTFLHRFLFGLLKCRCSLGCIFDPVLGISELKWTGVGEFNSHDHNSYYCGQESLRRNGVAITVNKRV